MTNEQREAIDRLQKLVKLRKDKTNTIKHDTCICGTMYLDTVLSILKEKDELYHKALTDLVKADRENIQIKKQIDLMAEHILLYNAEKENTELPDGFSTYKKALLNKEEVKQYFAGLVEKE